MLIDKCLPQYHFNEQHSIEVNGTTGDIYLHMLTANLRDNWLIKNLIRFGGLPHDVYAIADLPRMGFVKLAEESGNEIVYGIVTTSATFSSCHSNTTSSDFFTVYDPNLIKATINFRVKEKATFHQIVSTETRIWCGSKMKSSFRYYWFFIKPFSQLLRKVTLKELKRQYHLQTLNSPQ